MQVIAFKAIGADGLSTFLSGKIVSEGGNILAEFATEHNGMGKFILTPQKDSTYYAIATNKEGLQRKFPLPEVQSRGVILQVAQRENTCMYSFKNKTDYPTDSLFLIAHTRGMLLTVQPLSGQSETGKLLLTETPEGISNSAIVNRQGQVFCERLIFVKKRTDCYPILLQILSNTTEEVK